VNVHGYQGGGGRRDLLYLDVDGKTLWNTEYGDSDHSGVSLASNLNLDFRWLRPTAWCYWQALDWADWGLIDANVEDGWIGQPERKYYVLAHYTRHIRPGMIILDGSHGNTVVAYDGSARKLVIITMNYNTAQTVDYDLSAFYEASGPVRRWITETGSSVSYLSANDTAINNKMFSAAFAANTIQTFEIQNVDIHPHPALTMHPITNASEVILSWPLLYPDFNLYDASTLSSNVWLFVTNSPEEINGNYQVTVPISGNAPKFFRLANP
jgi:galactan endo-1,6-beta-galactosidase